MMKKYILALGTFMITLSAFAGEGMWLPMMLNRTYEDMQEHGLNLSEEQLYSINHSSLKDAIVSFGGFCTGEIISSEGLILTNHHCGYDAIRSHSTVEANYLRDGFWAMNRNEELGNPGLFVRFLIRMDDVTEQITNELNEAMSEEERAAKIAEISEQIVENVGSEGKGYEAEVKSFYHGNEFYLFIYQKFNDVRLVGAPPSSVGKFGGDTDNWMWPRHTGDFSMFRVYTDAEGNPAEFSADNVPMKPKHHLPISMKERKEGDYAMIFGYPGSTDRYLSSFGVKEAIELHHPAVVEVRDLKLAIMREAMDADEAVDIMLASSFAQTANYWKYFIGQTEQLINNHVFDKKIAQEEAFRTWVNADESRKAKYGQTLDLLEKGYAAQRENVVGNVYVLEAGLLGANTTLYAFRGYFGLQRYMTLEAEDQASAKEGILAKADEHYSEMHLPTDKKLMASLFALYAKNVPADQQPEFFATVAEDYNGDFAAWTEEAYNTSLFTSKERLAAWLDNPVDSILKSDMLGSAGADLFKIYQSGGNPEADEMLEKGYRLWTAGIREMNPDKMYAPDANSTMRVTYGNVLSYDPRDAVEYNFYTTLEGVMQKMDNDDREFIVPDRLVELYNNKDYGQYANANGELPVGFISNNDITGGNSGSPVINGDGELIGCAFDGNWEAMSGDIFFEKDLQRTISVDIRYVLFIVDKYAGAGHLVEEMDLVYPRKKFLGIF
ncbi:MAG: S46 family peptidase [Bacteroidetes bacterium]|nr:MAG: S46 family peptidase [Bacteroidota bacterium]